MAVRCFWDRILVINLTKQTSEIFSPGEDYYRQFLGGYGLGVRYLFEHLDVSVDPLNSDNIIGFFPGLLTGTGFPMTGRWMAVTKSPLTGLWNDSNCGGRCGPEMKQTGFDGVIFGGRATDPTYVAITTDGVDIHDAPSLWGKSTGETHDFLKKTHPKGKSLSIGPAGENLVRYASIMDDRTRAAARGGSGAVMGSKNLKAVVFQGSRKVPVADSDTFKEFSKNYRDFLKKSPSWSARQPTRLMKRFMPLLRRRKFHATASQGTPGLILATMKIYGTALATYLASQCGDAPVKNWSGIGYIDFPSEKGEKISDDNIIKYNSEKYACRNCYISCGAKAVVKEGKWKDEDTSKPEYESLAAFGVLCLIDDVEFIFKVNSLCDRMGLDVISTGATVAFAIESTLAGILDAGDLELDWGKPDPVYKLVQMIATRTGIGNTLADGVMRASDAIGAPSTPFAIHVHGKELPMHDPKHDPAYGIAYVAEATPGRHTQAVESFTKQPEVSRYLKTIGVNPPKRYDYLNKGRYQALVSPFLHVADSLGFCQIGMLVGNNPPLVDLINAGTGWEITLDSLFETGKRIKTLRQLFNIREGAVPGDFSLPGRAAGDPPQEKGPLEGITVDVETMKRSYYESLGWDGTSGMPAEQQLEKLGLKQLWEQYGKN